MDERNKMQIKCIDGKIISCVNLLNEENIFCPVIDTEVIGKKYTYERFSDAGNFIKKSYTAYHNILDHEKLIRKLKLKSGEYYRIKYNAYQIASGYLNNLVRFDEDLSKRSILHYMADLIQDEIDRDEFMSYQKSSIASRSKFLSKIYQEAKIKKAEAEKSYFWYKKRKEKEIEDIKNQYVKLKDSTFYNCIKIIEGTNIMTAEFTDNSILRFPNNTIYQTNAPIIEEEFEDEEYY
jgi:hypothetical protein